MIPMPGHMFKEAWNGFLEIANELSIVIDKKAEGVSPSLLILITTISLVSLQSLLSRPWVGEHKHQRKQAYQIENPMRVIKFYMLCERIKIQANTKK